MSEPPPPPSSTADPASEIAALYAQAFREFGVRALWNLRQHEHPTVDDALAITRALRTEGNMAARRLAEQIERLARADH